MGYRLSLLKGSAGPCEANFTNDVDTPLEREELERADSNSRMPHLSLTMPRKAFRI